MKNLMFVLLAVFTFSFSFAQSDKKSKENAIELKKNTAEVVKYITSELKLDDTQKAIVYNAFGEYSSNISVLNEKMAVKGANMTEAEVKKMTLQKMTEWSSKRDEKVMNILNDKQDVKYLKLCESFDPLSLSLKKKKK